MTIKTDFDAYTAVKEHLLRQEAKSYLDTDEVCAYRGYSSNLMAQVEQEVLMPWAVDYPHDLEEQDYETYCELFSRALTSENPDMKCAAGVLISDEFYDYELENNPVIVETVKQAIANSNPDWEMDEKSLAMMTILQKIHDSKSVTEWPKYLEDFTFDDSWNFVKGPDGIQP